ncbi:HD-GYP domain, c-di-GMP phosphodiesterase class II (or its inactivated variant) [Marinitoga hydrogenitolerans DSM 16785]|uniref:HD-GYP domain, c-di-GMP phosphodiesterase class II (Or its inactivated variant) n=1 Tax=Marinitoga hydrogenitolerans (strain DSM 16785 / JCM 12826 / AT1271) TaxID=1122195 RepID=A0A1M4X0Y0_MARH1|nr:HD domain-containing phosphohydrolase [Marinitoga hydrogenitolerans]SHE86852.1 HD-GYP domain, c-di-GMP phosphodiesterase class II (or its inactivated variant) [Marinitoga hydrogenitolerans DSM 16785]
MPFNKYKIYDSTNLSKDLLNIFIFDYISNINNAKIIISNKKANIDKPYILLEKEVLKLIENDIEIITMDFSIENFQILLLKLLSKVFNEEPFELLYLLEEKRKEVGEFIKNLIVLFEVEDKKSSMSHTQRVAYYAKKFADYLGKSKDEINLIYDVAMLHDIGRIGIEQLMLFSKTRVYDLEEWDLEHTIAGSIFLSNRKELWYAMDVVRSHHEHWDGTGYPDHLKKEEIPYLARFIGIIDWFDWATHTATSEHFGILSPQEAIEYIKFNLNKKFDPEIGKQFANFLKEYLSKEEFI